MALTGVAREPGKEEAQRLGCELLGLEAGRALGAVPGKPKEKVPLPGPAWGRQVTVALGTRPELGVWRRCTERLPEAGAWPWRGSLQEPHLLPLSCPAVLAVGMGWASPASQPPGVQPAPPEPALMCFLFLLRPVGAT